MNDRIHARHPSRARPRHAVRPSRRLVLLFAVLVCATPALRSQVRATQVLGRDDAEFARALQAAGYPDLCNVVLEMMKAAGTASGPAAEAAQIGIHLAQARATGDPAERKQKLKDLLVAMEAFLERYPTAPEAPAIQNDVPSSYEALAETIVGEIDASVDDVEKAARLREEGFELFKRAEKELAARLETANQQLADAGESASEDKAIERMVAFYAHARILYFHSLIYPEGSHEKNRLAERALEQFQEFDLDYDDRLMNIEGRVYQALCLRDMGQPDGALDMLDAAIKVREAFGRSDNGPWKMPTEAADYVSVAARQKVLMLTSLQRQPEAIAAGMDFLNTTREALMTAQGRGVMLAVAQAQVEIDPAQARSLADQLLEIDPSGYYGFHAKQLLADLEGKGPNDGGPLSARRMLSIAETAATGSDPQKALALCAKLLAGVRGTDQEADASCQAYMIIGAVYAKRGWLHEASLAFDAAHTTYPDAAQAPDALWRALSCYLELGGTDGNRFYPTRVEQLRALLVERYPNHSAAASAQLIEGRQLESQRNWEKAAELYLGVRAGSAAYFEARYRAGGCYFRLAQQLFGQQKADEGKAAAKRADELYLQLRQELVPAIRDTLDVQQQTRFRTIDFETVMSLAGLYSLPEIARPSEVLPLLDSLDPALAEDEERANRIWGYRIRALESLGKPDEALGLLNALIAKGTSPRSIAGPAGLMAGNLDRRAVELAKGQKNIPPEALELWRDAIRCYGINLQPQLSGSVPLRPTEAQTIANRLFAIGLLMNRVPEGVDTFLEWDQPVTEADAWKLAAEVYPKVIAAIPSVEATVNGARIHGFHRRWGDAQEMYSRLFTHEPIVDPATNEIDKELLAAKPLLLPAYLELGVVECHLGTGTPGGDNLRRSIEILKRVGVAAEHASRNWWRARYWVIKASIENGNYEEAGVLMRGLERNFDNFDGGKFGMADRLAELKRRIPK